MTSQTEYDSRWALFGVSAPAPATYPMRPLRVTCEVCGHVHHLEKRRTTAETVYIVCHGCEASLHAEYQPT